MANNQFSILKDATKSHLVSKKYVFRPRKPKMKGYGSNKKPIKVNGVIQYTDELYDPTPAKTVMLSFAFNMALENYQNMRPNTHVKAIPNLSDLSDMLVRFFSNKYYNNIEDITEANQLIDSAQNYEYEALERFRQVEYKLYGVIERFRNYHSHYIHEPGVMTLKDLFETDKTLTQSEFNDARVWFEKRFNDAHSHLKASLSNRKDKLELQKKESSEEEIKTLDKKIKQINGTLKAFDKITFAQADEISIDGQFFIACIFLTKRQAKVVLDKWRGLKDVQGFGNSLHTFFTYYSLSERYSINNFNDNLLKFRMIASRLSTVPYGENEKLAFIYEKIRELNEANYEELDKMPDGLSQKVDSLTRKKEKGLLKDWERSKFAEAKKKLAQKESLLNKIIPVRKKQIFTQVLLQYLLDNDLLKDHNFKIAVKKTPSDRLKYYEVHDEISEKESLTHLKERIKAEIDSQKRLRLNEHLKELKRNFVFKSPDELAQLLKERVEIDEKGEEITKEPMGYRFSIKKNNGLMQFQYGEKATINVVLAPDLLMKWVFLHLEKKQNVVDKIEHYITERYNKIKYLGVKEIVAYYKEKYPDISINRILPKSFQQAAGKRIEKNTKERATEYLATKIAKLERFRALNDREPKPWKFASKRKIDLILHYMQARLLEDVYINGIHRDEKDVDFIRHRALNMNTYNIAREYFRFFGRYQRNTIHHLEEYVEPSSIIKIKDEHALIFGYIKNEIDRSSSLEELFNATIASYIQLLGKQKHRIPTMDDAVMVKLFKIQEASNEAHINELLQKMYIKTIQISGEMISIKQEMKADWEGFLAEKRQKDGKSAKSYDHYSEFSFIRSWLSAKDSPATNIDFILQHILPLMPKDGKKDRKIAKVFNLLLKKKTEELVLWNIAKDYWLKANGQAYQSDQLKTNRNSPDFQEFCSFNKVYQQDLDYGFTIDVSFWTEKNKKKFDVAYKSLKNGQIPLDFSIKVPARRYDNKFIMIESALIKEYMIWYHFDERRQRINQKKAFKHRDRNIKRTFDLTQYDDVIKLIYKELIQSIQYIGALLRAEKKIVDCSSGQLMNQMDTKYSDKPKITDFYLALTDRPDKVLDYPLYQAFLAKANAGNQKVIEEYLVPFRNYALHYQLQNPKKVEIIFLFLKKINENINEDEYVTEE